MMPRYKILILVLGLAIPFFSYTAFASIDVYFSLVNDPEGAIIQELDEAKETIDMAVYYFTDRDFANAVMDAHDRGVRVRIYEMFQTLWDSEKK